MLAVSDRFLAAIRDTHTISIAARVYRPAAPTVPIAAQVVGGQMTCDIDATILRQATLDIAFGLTDPLTVEIVRELPFGGYCVLERGIRYASGETERVQLGRFRIDTVVWAELQGQASLTLNDRMAQIADEPFVTPWVATGQRSSDAIVAMVQDVFGSSIAYHVSTSPATEPVLGDTIYDEDRAGAISELASGIGAEALFDNLGDFVLRPRPSLDAGGTPVWTIDAGEGGVLLGAEESLDRSSVRNGVAMRAQADPALPPIYSLATDNDSASPTRWGGPFGKVALVARSSSIATQAQADAAAASLLNLRLGLSRNLTLRGVPNPALEPDDLIQIVHADGRVEPQIVNALTIGLDAEGELELTTRANWRPQAISPAARIQVWSDEAALREMDDAKLVEA
jgi:hypothetical protein